jgi:RNA polymerase sigma factor (sigma-70 family)
MTDKEKNSFVKTYEPLVNKLTRQFVDKVHAPWDDIKSMAYEGLVLAINSYDENRSKMTFTQYAAFAIRNNILTGLNNELRTVKLNAYAQKKAIESGEAVFNSVSIDFIGHDSSSNNFTSAPNKSDIDKLCVPAKFDDGDIFETLYTKLEDNFTGRDCKIFYMTFGLKGYDITKGKDIAEQMNISRPSVSVKVNTIISYIRKDSELMEILSNLIN